MKTTENLNHEIYGEDRIYVLYDNVRDEAGEIIDNFDEVDNYIEELLMSNEGFIEMEADPAVASYYGYENCIILGKDL